MRQGRPSGFVCCRLTSGRPRIPTPAPMSMSRPAWSSGRAPRARPTNRNPARRDIALDALREAIYAHGVKMPGTSTIPQGVTGGDVGSLAVTVAVADRL